MRRSATQKVTRKAGEYGCVALRLTGSRTGELLSAVSARCERLVNRAVVEPAERIGQRRLVGLALAAPFLIAAPLAILLPPAVGVSATLAVGGAVFSIAFLIAGVVIATGRAGIAGIALLLAGVPSVAAIVAAAGGMASPAVLVLGALVFEAWWVRRSRTAVLVGLGAASASLALQAVAGMEFFSDANPSAAGWLIPIAYLALVAPRVAAWLEETNDAAAEGALEEIVEGVVMRMDFSGEITEASAQSRTILGLAPELLLSTGVFDRMHVADRVAYLVALADLRQDAGFRRVPARMRVPGSAGQAASDFRPFVIEMMRRGEQEGCITMLLRPRDEAALADAPRAASDGAERYDLATARTLAAVSHELRTPLNSIIGFSDMLMQEMVGRFSDPRQKEYVGLVRDSGTHLLTVVNSILDVSRLKSGAQASNPEQFRFAEAVEFCRSMLGPQAAGRKVSLSADIAASVGEVHADKCAVRQMLINLVSNAVKFTPEGGSVVIGARRNSDRLEFWVSDTGIGIPADDLARVGEPFVQVRNDYTKGTEGAGLGLSLVKGLVALNQGTMAIESEQGQGTMVTITLPVEKGANGATDSAEIRAIGANRSKETYNGTYRKTA